MTGMERNNDSGNLLMLVGFGVGYFWGATLVRWSALVPLAISS